MKKSIMTALSASVALVGGITVLTASPAHAAPGMRVCGYANANGTGYLKMLNEGDASYGNDCKDAIEKGKNEVDDHNPDSDPISRDNKKAFEFIGKQPCEQVSAKLTSRIQHKINICDYMDKKIFYAIYVDEHEINLIEPHNKLVNAQNKTIKY